MKSTDLSTPNHFHKVVDCQWACPAHTPVPQVHPVDRGGSLRCGLYGQLGGQCLPGYSRPHLRPTLRAGLPSWSR